MGATMGTQPGMEMCLVLVLGGALLGRSALYEPNLVRF